MKVGLRLLGAFVACMAGTAFGQVRYTLTDVGTLGGSSSWTSGLNVVGEAVGESYLSGDLAYHAYLYSGGNMTDLGTLGGAWSWAAGINASGQVAGYAYNATGQEHAFLYSSGSKNDLGTLGGLNSAAGGLNDLGEVVGYSNLATGVIHAFLYSGGKMQDLGSLGGAAARSEAMAVNASGQIVGESETASGGYDAFLYSGGKLSDLGVLPGDAWSEAEGINASGQIVGSAQDSSDDWWGFLYENGTMANLNGLLDSSGSGWTVVSCAAISDSGQIAASAMNSDGYEHAVLLTPSSGFSGKVNLHDFSGDVTQISVTIEVRNPGTTTDLQSQVVALASDGSFWVPCALTGTYDVAAKASHWLRQRVSGVTFNGGVVSGGVSFSLINGDVDGDNTINLADLVAMAKAWRSTPGSSNWNVNADVNGDGTVNLADWMVVARNWRKSGDP